MKAKKKRQLGRIRGGSLFSVALISLGLISYFMLLQWAFIFLIVFSEQMPKWLYFTLLFLYIASITTAGMYLYRRLDLRRERAQYGDEAFFQAYPREWKRELRRWKKTGAYHTVQNEAPAVLQRSDGSPLKQGLPYDELYYRMCPKALKRDLKVQRLRRRFLEKIASSQRAPSPYEQRLAEIKTKFDQKSEEE